MMYYESPLDCIMFCSHDVGLLESHFSHSFTVMTHKGRP